MVRTKARKSRKKQQNFRKSTNNIPGDAVSHPPVPHTNSVEDYALAPVLDSNETATKKTEEPVVDSIETATKKTEDLAGYIFMCSGRTKPDCYVNRVFGLPIGKKEIVEKIKPGAKLFLYDYDVRFLYGVYEAATAGGMNLQPTAFEGKFPAQVQFKICYDGLPVPLDSFKTAIKDNYQGSKFAQELNDQQVKDLLMLFKPIVATSSATLPPPTPTPNPAHGPWVQPPRHQDRDRSRARNGRRKSSVNPHVQKRYQPYTGRGLHNHSQQPHGPRLVHEKALNTHSRPHHQHPPATHQAHPVHVNPHQFAKNQQSYFYNDHPGNLRESYPRYITTPEVYHHDQTIGFNVGYNGLAPQTTMNHIGTSHGHNPNPTPAAALISLYGSTPQTTMNRVGTSHGYNPNPTPAPAPASLYGSTSLGYSGSTYLYPQPSMPVSVSVSSYYPIVGGPQINR